jgi:hypothetical protein
MDAKITLSFDEAVIYKTKQFAAAQNISLSRLTEFLYLQITSGHYKTLEELPVASWVNMLAERKAEYVTRKKGRREMKKEYFNARK